MPNSKIEVVWNPRDYAANSASQQSWALELIARLDLRGTERILDVGCGDGKVTAELARAVPQGEVVGIDASPDMIRFARETFPAMGFPNLRFEIMDARQIRLEKTFDLVFSNAALHWVNNHQAFLQGAAGCLKAGGRLIVSCGGKGNAHDIFLALRSCLREKPWRKYFRRLSPPYFFFSPDEYAQWLPDAGFHSRNVHLANKDMTFDSVEKLTGWLRTTWLPYTQRVPEAERETFIAAVTERYLHKHPPDAHGRIHVRMVRLDIDAVKV